MQPSTLYRYALSLSAAATLLAGCGGSQPPIGAPGAMAPQVTPIERHVEPDGSWMLAEAKRKSLLYISSANGGVYVYTYPANQFVGQLSGFVNPAGVCSDKAGHIFVTDYFTEIVSEFAHGGTQPIATFTQYSNEDFGPFSCSVDENSKNLAVESLDSNKVYIFKHEGQAATIYQNPYATGDFCAYDGSGNFFARGSKYHIAELAKGASAFTNIKLSRPLADLVGFAWDGKYLSIGANDSTYTVSDYRVRVQGSKARIVASETLTDAKEIFQFTIYNGDFIGPDFQLGQVTSWKYPRFGKPVSEIQGLTEPIGSAISVAPS